MTWPRFPKKLGQIIAVGPRSLYIQPRLCWNNQVANDGVLPYSAYDNSSSWDIKRFLEEVGTGAREARFWLKIFQYRDANPAQPFAVMQVCQSTFKRPHMLSKLGSSLAFLHKNGLKSVVVHGLHNKEEDRDSEQGRQKLIEQGLQLADAVVNEGAKATPFINCSGIFRLKMNENNHYEIDCNAEPIKWCLGNGYIPVVSSIAEIDNKTVHVCPIQACDDLALTMKPLKVMYLNSSGGLLNEWGKGACSTNGERYVCPIQTCNDLALTMKPLKVMYLNSSGGLLDEWGKVMEQINIPLEEKDRSSNWCTERIRFKVHRIANMLQQLPLTASAVITSADSLLKELFTHRGSGTIFKIRERICVHRSFKTINTDRLLNLLQKTFKKKLRDDYLTILEEKLDSAYITESYSAAAIITREPSLNSVPYWDKFVVVKENQGLGSGEILWDRIKEDYPSLFWRSRRSNRINSWYFARAEGSWTNGRLTVFWYGVNNPKLSHKIIDFAVNHPSTFDDVSVGEDGTVNPDGALYTSQ